MGRFIATALPLGTLLTITSDPAWACGPGVHVREADRTFDRIVLADTGWENLAVEPMALAYLRLGAIAPDFEWAIGGLGFGHALGLSYHLLDRAFASGDARFAWFALGHLAHVSSDPSCEMFLTPTVFASVPLGMTDFVQGYDGPGGEAEGIVEGLGDLVLGRWDAVVDLVYDMWADGDVAKDRGREAFLWYCTEGAAFSGTGTDCYAALATFEGLLSQVDPILAGLSRQEAKDLVFGILSQPMEALAEVFASGFLSSLVGGQGEPTPWVHEEVERLLATPLGDRLFWTNLYENFFADLGPTWTVDRALNRFAEGWPGWSEHAVVCGNIESVMQFVPEAFAVHPGWIVDGVWWRDETGAPVDRVMPDREGAIFTAHVRCYSAVPFQGTVRAVVRKDSPGFESSGDEVVGEVVVPVVEDPFAATRSPRKELDVPFVADTEGAIGFYLEMYVNDEDRPWFTTSWDRLWTIDALDLWRPQYRENFGTYGHWPPSLPVMEPGEAPASLFVWVRSGWDLGELPGAWVEVVGDGEVARTGANGIAVLDRLSPGLVLVRVGGPGHAVVGPWSLMLPPLTVTWLEVVLDRLPFQGASPSIRPPWSEAAPSRIEALGSPVPPAEIQDTADKGPTSVVEKPASEVPGGPWPPVGEEAGGSRSDIVAGEYREGNGRGQGGGCRTLTGPARDWPWLAFLVALGMRRRRQESWSHSRVTQPKPHVILDNLDTHKPDTAGPPRRWA